jgi:hypothetical protein
MDGLIHRPRGAQEFAEIEIEQPRDRNAEFDPKIIAKRQTSIGNFTELSFRSTPGA